MTNIETEIFNNLKKYIEKNSPYADTKVMQYVVDKKYPLVVFELTSNQGDYLTKDITRIDKVRNMSFEIDVIAKSINNIPAIIVCKNISELVIQVMQDYYGMQGGLDSTLKNINKDLACKSILHFTCKWDNTNKIIL